MKKQNSKKVLSAHLQDSNKKDKRLLVLFVLCVLVLSLSIFPLPEYYDKVKQQSRNEYVYNGHVLSARKVPAAAHAGTGKRIKDLTANVEGYCCSSLPPVYALLFHYPFPINAASEEELQLLPGIGKVTASRIYSYRIAHGPFRSAEELLQIKGMGEKKIKSINQLIDLSL